jgi:hypothetical protein
VQQDEVRQMAKWECHGNGSESEGEGERYREFTLNYNNDQAQIFIAMELIVED